MWWTVGGADATRARRARVVRSDWFARPVSGREAARRSNDADAPTVQLLYRQGWVLWDEAVPGRGGYYARIAGFGEQGEGRTAEQAIERLASALRDHVERWDAAVDEYARTRRQRDSLNPLDRPPLVRWTRSARATGRLTQALYAASQPPVLADY
jgi:hypothetical protein